MAAVRIDDRAFADPRIDMLAGSLGINRYEALGRMAHLWRACTDREAYVLGCSMVKTIMGSQAAVDALIEADLAEGTPQGLRIKGTEGRIEWLKNLRNNGKKGGRPKKPDGNQAQTRAEPGSNPLTLTLTTTHEDTTNVGVNTRPEEEGLPPADRSKPRRNPNLDAGSKPVPVSSSSSTAMVKSVSPADRQALMASGKVDLSILCGEVQMWPRWKKFIGLGHWSDLGKALSPFTGEEVAQARLECESKPGEPSIGFLLRVIETNRAKPMAQPRGPGGGGANGSQSWSTMSKKDQEILNALKGAYGNEQVQVAK